MEEYCHDHDFSEWKDHVSSPEEFQWLRTILSTECLCTTHHYNCSIYKRPDSPSAATALRMMEYAERIHILHLLQKVIHKKNQSLTREDAQKYNLVCGNYCSYGYCRCDVMPRMYVSNAVQFMNGFRFHEESDDSDDSDDDEETVAFQKVVNKTYHDVYLLSEIVHGDNGHWYGRPTKLAWTMPCELWDNPTEYRDISLEEIESMIIFDYL